MDPRPFAVAIGSSAGGIDVLLALAAAMPARFPAVVLVTQHIGNHPSLLPELMRARGPNHAMHPEDGDVPLPGTIYVAPPDHHLLVDQGRIRLLRGPKENYARPAIDPMFRSVALAYRSAAIGVVLTGYLDDGAAGLKAIKACGGTAIVQDPATAAEPSMPLSALANVDVDLRLGVDEIVPHLLRIIGARPSRAVAHAGRAFPAQSVAHARGETAEHALWRSVRSLQEKEMLLRRAAMVARSQGDPAQAAAAEGHAKAAHDEAERLTKMIEQHGGRSA